MRFDRSAGRWLGDTVGRAPVMVAGLLSSCVANAVLGPLPWLGLPPGGHTSVWAALAILVGAPLPPHIMRTAQCSCASISSTSTRGSLLGVPCSTTGPILQNQWRGISTRLRLSGG